MQITIDLPEPLGEKFKIFPNLNDFIIKLLSESLANVSQSVWQKTPEHVGISATRKNAIEDLLQLSHNACSRRGDQVWARDELHLE